MSKSGLLAGLTSALVILLTAAPAAEAQGGLIGEYTARLSARDHFNSNGARLRTAAAIIRQDRANYHKFGKRDREDEWDPFFGRTDTRARLERMLAGGSTSRSAVNAIVNGEPMIRVRIYRNYVDVTVF